LQRTSNRVTLSQASKHQKEDDGVKGDDGDDVVFYHLLCNASIVILHFNLFWVFQKDGEKMLFNIQDEQGGKGKEEMNT